MLYLVKYILSKHFCDGNNGLIVNIKTRTNQTLIISLPCYPSWDRFRDFAISIRINFSGIAYPKLLSIVTNEPDVFDLLTCRGIQNCFYRKKDGSHWLTICINTYYLNNNTIILQNQLLFSRCNYLCIMNICRIPQSTNYMQCKAIIDFMQKLWHPLL